MTDPPAGDELPSTPPPIGERKRDPADRPVQDTTLFSKEVPGAGPRQPGTLPPAPPGLTATEWAETFYGTGRERRSGLSFGRGWLLGLLLLAGLVVLLVLIIVIR